MGNAIWTREMDKGQETKEIRQTAEKKGKTELEVKGHEKRARR
jgi:hypothetical protein